jgi:small acid-soluble spore protein F (minor alpha/beta-type SASP)
MTHIQKNRRKNTMTEEEERINAIKLEIADELGLLDTIKEKGWSGLNAQECGRIGGKLAKRLRVEAQRER